MWLHLSCAEMFIAVPMTSFMQDHLCLHSWSCLESYRILEHWYQPGEHQTAFQPETEYHGIEAMSM